MIMESSIGRGNKKPRLCASIHSSKNNLVHVIHRELPGRPPKNSQNKAGRWRAKRKLK